MNNLINLEKVNNELFASFLEIAKNFAKRHASVLQAIYFLARKDSLHDVSKSYLHLIQERGLLNDIHPQAFLTAKGLGKIAELTSKQNSVKLLEAA